MMNDVRDKRTMKQRKPFDRKILNKTMMKRLTAAAAICTILSTVIMLGCRESKTVEQKNYIGQIDIPIIMNLIINNNIFPSGYNIVNSPQDNEIPVNNAADKYDVLDDGIADENKADALDNVEDNMKSNVTAEEAIGRLSLGMNRDYIIEFMGTPICKLLDNGLSNLFFLLEEDDVVIRCVFSEEDSLVGYFVTVKKIAEESGQVLEFPNPMSYGESLRYGHSTVADTESGGEESIVAANMGTGGENNYYWQRFHLLYTKGFDGFIVAAFPYGFYEYESDMLMELTSADEKRLKAIIAEEAEKLGMKENEVLPYYKSTAHPNTYGVINMKYEEKIGPSICEAMEWEACLDMLSGE